MDFKLVLLQVFFLIFLAVSITAEEKGVSLEEEKYGVKYATQCEVCKLVTKEIGEMLEKTDSSDVIETGYNIDSKKKKTKYNKSELRLVEVLESVCEGMQDYRVHKERLDSTRWAKMMSQTFRTLHGLVNKGVKVELGIPFELWDEPSAEVTHLKTQCEQFLEEQEERISSWYFSKSAGAGLGDLQQSLCPAMLSDAACLQEPYGETITPDQAPSEDKSEL
ncbi:protein canopy homolog 4 [Hyalella azteca]|uniref:Protein canopy homolog 4 n=1 Tax=Hyalella azteca TaxID=294128 RepID=A0A8B7NKA8_HYAAZ|nr:protein canopy homolog 4 [Hyalella azteca]